MPRLASTLLAAALIALLLAARAVAAPVALPFASGGHQYELKIDDSYLPYGSTPTLAIIHVCLPTMRACGPRTKDTGETSYSIHISPQNTLWFRETPSKSLQRVDDPALSRLAKSIGSNEVLFASDPSACENVASGVDCSLIVLPAADTPCARGEVDGLRMADRCRVIWCSASHLQGYYGGLCSYWFSHLSLPMSLTFVYADGPAVLSNLAPISQFIDEHVRRK